MSAEEARSEVMGQRRPPGRPCGVAAFVATLSERDRQVFELTARMEDVGPYDLKVWLKAKGYTGGEQQVGHHSRSMRGLQGGCSCKP